MRIGFLVSKEASMNFAVSSLIVVGREYGIVNDIYSSFCKDHLNPMES